MPASVPVAGRLYPPEHGGATIRMYRIGHGDCFLIAFPGKGDEPVYVLIDCGYKPGSQDKLSQPTTPADIAADIAAATGKIIDLAILTHEHQDHLNGITEKGFAGFTIKNLWLAWTEDRNDSVANALRAKHKDTLIGLTSASGAMTAMGLGAQAAAVEEFLEMELGEPAALFQRPGGRFGADGGKKPKNPEDSSNKKSMNLFKQKAGATRFLRPHEQVLNVPGTSVRAFVLGPPRDPAKIGDTEPDPEMAYEKDSLHALASPALYFGDALRGGAAGSPFSPVHSVPMREAFTSSRCCDFFKTVYGDPKARKDQQPDILAWRRIDGDWLGSAGSLALAMNDDTNNSSLVLAFEIPPAGGGEDGATGKILLFTGDAQAGNWLSWADKTWKNGDREISAADLLANTVLYKAGHHGSHNATLKGGPDNSWPNLAWMGQGARAGEFTAMITAVRKWAITKKDGKWDHPLPSIKEALLKKSQGRVIQTDTDRGAMAPMGGTNAQWDEFMQRFSAPNHLYFDLQILP